MMFPSFRVTALGAALVAASLLILPAQAVHAESRAGLREDAAAALDSLYKRTPSARVLGKKAKAILVFPHIVKAGFIVGAAYGQGVLTRQSGALGYYNSVAGSYGLQAGAQAYGYAMFLMTDEAVRYLDKSDGWEIGVGPSVVVIDSGLARTLTTTTMSDDVYAFIFDQKGLMAGLGIQGSKISRISE